MPICLDDKVSFKLVIQANSAGDESNILISSVTDTFPTRKYSTEPKISHMLLYIDLHLLSILCQQKYLKSAWRKKCGVSGDTKTFDSMPQWLSAAKHPGTGFSILSQTQGNLLQAK